LGDSLNQKKQSLAPLKYEGHSRCSFLHTMRWKIIMED
jgi:hypothetical protein